MIKDQTATGTEQGVVQGGSDHPPSNPPNVQLTRPVFPTEALNRQRKSTMRFAAAVERISEGQPVELSLIERMRADLEEARRANAELEANTRRQNQELAALKSALRSTSDAIICCDLKGRITMFNPGAEAIFQLEVSEKDFKPETSNGLGDNLFHLCEQQLYKGETGSVPDAGLMERLKTNGTVQNLRIVFKGNRGAITHTLFSLDYMLDDHGKATGLIANIKNNNEVELLTQVDPLTELFNRRHLDTKIREVQGLLKRGHYDRDCVSVLFLDVDHFGEFNKKYGHSAGDEVLKTVAKTLRHACRDDDTVARYGGEEFVIILPTVDEAGMQAFAERLCRTIANTQVAISGVAHPLSVTASIGIATHHKGSGTTKIVLDEEDKARFAKAFLEKANQAMLTAKRNGRNQVKASIA